MRFIDLFKLSTRMFRARTSRTLLTIFGMGVGIAAILFLLSLGFGLQNSLLEKITTTDSLLSLDVMSSESGIVVLDESMVGKLRNISGAEEVVPVAELAIQARVGGLLADLASKSAPASYLRLEGIELKEGVPLSEEKKENVVIASAVAEIFGKNLSEMIGQEIELAFLVPQEESGEESLQNNFESFDPGIKYVITGIVESRENVIFVNAGTLGGLKIKKYDKAKVKCSDPEKLSAARGEIEALGLKVQSLSDTVEDAKKIFKWIQLILTLFGIIALAVSAIGMFNTMTIALLERTEEIGIMKSIGASDLAISLMFIMEATVMGFMGGLLGIIIGLAGSELVNKAIDFIAIRRGAEPIDLFDIPLEFILGIAISAGIVGFLTGILPARRASKIDPLDALRYK